MIRQILLGALISAMFLATGCSIVAPNYSASIKNIETLKSAGEFSTKVGSFDSGENPKDLNSISLRGTGLKSPYAGSYSNYLTEALIQELSLAGKLSSITNVEISGVLQRNKIDAMGFSVGTGEIEARFIVKNNGVVQYDRVKAVTHEWKSSFVGGIAIPKAQQEYLILVQKLLAALYADADFFMALK